MQSIIDTSSLETVIYNFFVPNFFKEKSGFFLKTENMYSLLGS